MNQSFTLQQLQNLKLAGMALHYEGILSLPTHQHPDGHTLVASMAEAEILHRSNAKMKLYLQLSKLRYQAHLHELDYSKDRNLNQSSIQQLADCSYIKRAENMLITGATGVGKSFVACAFGQQACAQGHKVLYYNLNKFIEKIAQAKLEGNMNKLLDSLDRVALLILDDFGLMPLDDNTRLALLQILEDRYERKSIIIASQLPIASWYEYINQSTIADAIMDRLTSSAHRIELKGKSLRKKTK